MMKIAGQKTSPRRVFTKLLSSKGLFLVLTFGTLLLMGGSVLSQQALKLEIRTLPETSDVELVRGTAHPDAILVKGELMWSGFWLGDQLIKEAAYSLGGLENSPDSSGLCTGREANPGKDPHEGDWNVKPFAVQNISIEEASFL